MKEKERQRKKDKPKIIINSVTVRFKTQNKTDLIAVDDVSLNIEKNQITCIMGPSGCGKTTLLNVMAGLLRPSSGTVEMDGKVITEPGPDRAVVFQQDAVFPWMNVEDNISFGLKVQKKDKKVIKETVDHYIKLVKLEKFRKAWPKELSGGMRKRVDIARAYVANPEVLLLDEPFGSLDVITKEHLQQELYKIWLKEPKTIVFITHDVEEALFLGDTVVVMSAQPGKIKSIIYPKFSKDKDISIKTDSKFINYRKDIRENVL